MPHLIIEYSPDVISDDQAAVMVDAVFTAAVSTKLFETANLKVRAIPATTYRLGLSGRGFISVLCRIHAGRGQTQKKQLSEAIIKSLRQLNTGVAVMTAEVVEMDRDSYTKAVSHT